MSSQTSVNALVMLQNPVNSLMVEVGMQQLLAPLLSLTIECGRYCKAPFRHKPMLLITLCYLVPMQLVMLLGPGDLGRFGLHPVKLFHFPKIFCYQNELVLVCSIAACSASMNVARRLLAAKHRRKIGPV